MRALTFRERLRDEAAKAAAAETADPWHLRLERVRGRVDFFDGLERISSQTLLDLLEVPQRQRTAGTYRRLARVMAELGWTAVRMRDLSRGGYLEQVRGWCRQPRMHGGHRAHLPLCPSPCISNVKGPAQARMSAAADINSHVGTIPRRLLPW